MATERLRTIKPSGQGGDYTSVASWEAGEQANLVTADEYRVGEIQGTWSVADVIATIDSSTTDATRYLELRTDSANRHNGVWSTAKHYIASAVSYGIRVADPDVRIVGIQVESTGVPAFQFAGGATVAATSFSSCLAKIVGAAADGFAPTGAGGATLSNCVAFGDSSTNQRGARTLTNASAAITALNCTAYGCVDGFFRNLGTFVVKNCLAQGNTTDFSGTFDASSTNNCDEDSTAPGANSVTETVTFVDAANGDLHISSATSAVLTGGTDLSGSGVTTDFEGNSRHATTPTIGADEYVTASTFTPRRALMGVGF